MGMKVYADDNYLGFFESLSSATRLKILRILSEKPYNIKELSEAIGYSPAIITRHIDLLEKNGLVECCLTPASRGRQKICALRQTNVTVFLNSAQNVKKQKFVIPIGKYDRAVDLQSPCGLEKDGIPIGIINDPRYFMAPDRIAVNHIWFSNGMLKYRVREEIIGTVLDSFTVRVNMSVSCHENVFNQGNLFFGICEKFVCNHTLGTYSQPREICLTVNRDGVFLNGQLVNNAGIDKFELDLSKLTFEIGSGYYNGQKSIVELFSTNELPGIEIEIEVN